MTRAPFPLAVLAAALVASGHACALGLGPVRAPIGLGQVLNLAVPVTLGEGATIGGGSTINGVASGSKLNNLGFGLTLGYTINENLNLTVGYKSTVNDSGPTDLRMDGFMVTLVFGWHPTIEGMRRLKRE